MSNDIGLIFVYGTLKEKSPSDSYARIFDDFRLRSVSATVKGTLYDLGYFPALVLGGNSVVYGELHKYKNFRKVIATMDQIEGYHGRDNCDNLYRRVKVQVAIDASETYLTATAYEFAQAVGEAKVVSNGVWEMDMVHNT